MRLSSFVKNAIVLGLLSAVGPFAIDMYLPALPTIAANLQASTAATQMTLMAFFAAFGICQIVYGPVSDMIGRKPPLYFGLGDSTKVDRVEVDWPSGRKQVVTTGITPNTTLRLTEPAR